MGGGARAEGTGPAVARSDLRGPAPRAMLVALVAAFVVQCLWWAAVGAGVRRVQEAAPSLEAPETEKDVDGASTPDASAGPDVPSRPVEALPLSVVVAARDEAERLPALLDALAAQTHRPFEVVVVDDRSTDRTAQVVTWRAQDFPVPLRLVRVEAGAPEAAGLPPKKHALERGLEAAAHDRVAVTDADGRPGPRWLETLARWASTTAEGLEAPIDESAPPGSVLVGYGPYVREPGWLNRFVRFETAQTAAWAAAGVGLGRPWHAVGRNLSYPRSLLEALGGFAHSAGSLSGDDDLLVQEVARTGAAPVRYVWDARAAVPSPAPAGWGAFWRQKRRHASAGAHYPAAVLVALGAAQVSNLVLWVGAPVLHLALGLPYGWGMLAGKLLLQRQVLGDVLDGLGDEPDLRLWQPVLDALSAVYHAAFAVLGLLPTPRRW